MACDVIGTANDDVTYSSSDTSIATVDNDGVVTGIKIGTCKIRIQSVLDASIETEYDIEVVGSKSKNVEVVLDGDTKYPYDAETGTYTVPMGKEFYVTYKLDEGSSIPDNIAFSLVTPVGSDSTIARLTQTTDGKAKIETFGKVNGLVVKITISYAADGSDAISNAATFNVVDENEMKMDEVEERLSASTSFESSSLTSVKYAKEVTNTSDNSKSTTNIDYSLFKNATYSKVATKTYEGNTQKSSLTLSYYSGVDTNRGRAYYFNYNLGGIKNVYMSQAASSEDILNASLANIPNGGTPVFGIAEIIKASSLYNGSFDQNVLGLSYIGMYANSEISLTESEITIESTYNDTENGYVFDADFKLEFDAGKITSYTFQETVEYDNNTVTYKESFSDFVYGDKKYDSKENNNAYLDITKYYMEDYTLEDASGTKGDNEEYDFTNEDKYKPDTVEVIDGVTNYTLSYDKTLVLKVTPSTNNASTLIDVLDCKSSSTDDIPNPTRLGNNIYSVACATDNRGNALTGEADITFTSIKGIEKKIHVKFVKSELRGILVTNITNHDLGKIFRNESTQYFYLNSIPDEDIYSFELEMAEGNASDLTLYRNSYDNLDGLPGFSYSIKGNNVGKFSFRFKITGTEFKSDVYTLEVVEPYSKEYLINNLVTNHKVFQYVPGGTVKFELTFTSETNLKLTQFNMYDDSRIDRDIAVTFGEGTISISDYQVIHGDTTENAFFYSILGGKLAFNESLTEIYPYLDAYEESLETGNGHHSKYTFSEKIDTSTLDTYVKGAELIANTYVPGYGLTNATMTFDPTANKASLILKNAEGSTYGTIKFVYVYSATTATFTLDEIAASNNVVMIKEPSIYFIESTSVFRLKISINGVNYVFDFHNK